MLEELYEQLFPEPPPLDLITVDDILLRYPLTGLGVLALAAIDQSQRIIRSQSDYSLVGSSEYHIGLIYLNWDDCRAAANQFSLARQPWMLASDFPAICLSHFAQGTALFHAYHNEAAVVQFSRAERLLKRPMVGAAGARMAMLAKKMRPYLKAAQDALHIVLWPIESGAGSTTGRPAGARSEDSAAPEPPSSAGAAADTPRHEFDRPPRPSENQSDIPRPISNLDRYSPVPGHICTDDRFGWYQIAEKTSKFLPTIGPGVWLLADKEFDEQLSDREYVVVGSRQNNLGSIRVKPMSQASVAVPHCYFGYREPDAREPSGARLYLDETRKPIPPDNVHVLAVVAGYWNGLNGHALPET